ncbi:succinyl-CoA synthetase subunit alpha [Pseudovibrio axinellae]|uniref:Succinyl-CoA synthetase subunit alpha n=1 Tax=Pseudovibrio axinellae TaxID=989403 RepID=A0A165VUZ6_9HYPH|nr:acetate--CoA ligase family protein [Pseudovibrio axinellae]KZL15487.1 succinyl-CoA synthetase subunit alpha [Pseudovibrio axinellae]SEQ02185.1 6-carboxyhexanoate-CoA ligase [Pseudovibrio axinellae]
MTSLEHIDGLIAPNSVAIIGASEDPTRIGGRPIAAMLKAGYKGRIMPVNPKRDTVQGLPCFASIEGLPEAPEAALVAVPAKFVPQCIEALGRKGCKAATLFSAGFAEAGEEGEAAQRELMAIAARYGLRLLGPNTLGVYNVEIGYYGTFSSSLDTGFPIQGNIGIASQSGAFGAHLGALARDQGLGCSVLITTGNEADITVADAVRWMAASDSVDVICTYMEAVNDAPALLAALDVARAAGKPVLALKSGRSAVGALAAASHTASLTGDAVVADAVLSEHGAIILRDPESMMDIAYAASKKVFPQQHSLGVVTISGGAGIVASDEAERIGLPMPAMPDAAQAKLLEVLPYGSPVNPLDCTAQALNEPGLLEEFTRAGLEEGGYGAVLCFLTYVAGSEVLSKVILEAMAPLREAYPNRIIAFCALGEPAVLKRYDDAGILIFNDPCRAVRALDAVLRLGAAQSQTSSSTLSAHQPVKVPATSPDEAEAKVLLAEAGIVPPPEQAVHSAEEAVKVAEEIGYPVVMKILSPDIVHKFDIGAVKLNIRDMDGALAAHAAILAAVANHAPYARVKGVLVAKQISGGVECLMGINRDPTFGPVAVFGLGGIFVELLNDVALRACPFGPEAAREMLLSIRCAAILQGARGTEPADIDALAKMLSNLSIFAVGIGERLVSIDLNPVLAMPEGQGAYALDAVIELDSEEVVADVH